MTDRIELITNYLRKVKTASKELTKKELFKDLLHRLYAGEKEIEDVIDAISAGAEKTILNTLAKTSFTEAVPTRSTTKSLLNLRTN